MTLRDAVVLGAAIAAAALTARLGVWQLDRAAQKTNLQQAIEARASMPRLETAALAATREEAALQHHRPVRLTGRWVADRTVFLDNRQMDGRPGFFVVTPLLIGEGGDAVLVQRGWVPRDRIERTRLPLVATPAGPVQIDGRIAPPPARLLELAEEGRGPIRQNLDIDAFAGETGLKLRPLSVVQLGEAGDGLERRWVAPATDVQKHHGYAFQWFALAALIAVLYVWFQLVRPRLQRRR
jgi:surfeit locus 1 family protein